MCIKEQKGPAHGLRSASPVPGRLRGKDCWESEAGLGCKASSRPGWAAYKGSVSKAKQTNKQKKSSNLART